MIPAYRLASLISSASSSSSSSTSPYDGSSSTTFTFASLSSMVPMPHQMLPFPFNEYVARYLLLKDLENADAYLVAAIVLLVSLVIYQIRAFTRPPPVPRKLLPVRPVLSVLFHPEDDFQQAQQPLKQQQQQPADKVLGGNINRTKKTSGKPPGRVGWRLFSRRNMQRANYNGGRGLGGREEEGNGVFPAVGLPERQRSARGRPRSESNEFVDWDDDEDDDGDNGNNFEGDDDEYGRYRVKVDDDDYDNGTEEETPTAANESGNASGATSSSSPPTMPSFLNDLPDSFAPLLSSSSMEVLANELVASQLLHALQVDATVRLRQGRHELPLDKDASRPQLGLDVPVSTGRGGGGGVKLSASASIGSDQLSAVEDFDVRYPTRMRSQPMVKKASLTLDPPLPLINVAPTLVHFPTLFEDKTSLPTLRRLPVVRLLMDVVVSMSSFLERCLWIVESKCQIHLSHIRLVPLYKGPRQQPAAQDLPGSGGAHAPTGPRDRRRTSTHAAAPIPESDHVGATHPPPPPDWRLQLSFSGHVLLFGWIPIPFINVTLPTWIIPQPHALLEYLLTPQPLASARVRRENLAERRIALALIGTAESWTLSTQLVATPPAVSVDITLPGGVAVAVEMGLGRDPHAGRSSAARRRHGMTGPSDDEADAAAVGTATASKKVNSTSQGSINSMSSWTTKGASDNSVQPDAAFRASNNMMPSVSYAAFDANDLVPWKVELSAKGSLSDEKLSFHLLKLAAEHEGVENGIPVSSKFGTRGSFAVWKFHRGNDDVSETTPRRHRRLHSFGSRMAAGESHSFLADDAPSVSALLLFPEETEAFHRSLRFLQYDYAFDVFEHSKLESVTVTVAATHPMLNGGTMVTTVLDSIYAYGSVAARDDAIIDPDERKRKRNVLRHLPATDFTLGVTHVYIPPESYSYSDDGQTLFVPDASGGRMMIRFLGGIQDSRGEESSYGSNVTPADAVYEGVKVVADFEVPSLVVRSEGKVKEFPELDVFEGVKLLSHLSGIISGGVRAHLRPEKVTAGPILTTGRNVFNPLEAYEIDFSGSSLAVKIKECTVSLGHRRVIFPAETTVAVKINESIVDLTFEGKTQCELSWDFQGLSPILQVTAPGKSPADATPEDKQQMSLLVAPLRQGRLSLNVSSVGGINITKAATSREDKEGLYDWKFFNAIVSPDQDSAGRILDVLHDKRTMEKLLQVIQLVNKDLHKILRYILRQLWRAKDLFDQEGISDPGHIIPMYKMARLISLFITGDSGQVERIIPILERVVQGEGLDIVEMKELLRENLDSYDDWAPELDRAVRWLAVCFGPTTGIQPFVEENVAPLAQLSHYERVLRDVPSASYLYDTLLDKRLLPLEPSFSNLVSRVAPYLSFKQIKFFLETRGPSDWQAADLKRIRYVYSIKRKVLEIAESYGGLSFLPQSFLVSVFLGEATRKSLRATALKPQKSKRSSFSSKSSSGRMSSKMSLLRQRRGANLETRLQQVAETSSLDEPDGGLLPPERVAFLREFNPALNRDSPQNLVLELGTKAEVADDAYELGDSLLGPQDVAILLQAGLTSAMKSSTVVQLNQRMLLDLICSQPRSFAVAVLSEIGSPGGQGSVRGLTSALMSLLELDQSSFKEKHQIDMRDLLESWLPGVKIPRREDYLAGGRWARQSYYEALFSVATSILDDAESYTALKLHLQRVRTTREADPIPHPRDDSTEAVGLDFLESAIPESIGSSKLQQAVSLARASIDQADQAGKLALDVLFRDPQATAEASECKSAAALYSEAFAACTKVLSLDKHAFHAPWFRDFYRRNYDALMILSIHDNLIDNVDNVRHWLQRLSIGAKKSKVVEASSLQEKVMSSSSIKELSEASSTDTASGNALFMTVRRDVEYDESVFLHPEQCSSQVLVDAILDCIIFEEPDRERLRRDPLVRLLIRNPPGRYNFTIVTAMGVVTDGKRGIELRDAFVRLEKLRGVKTIRSDTATARSLDYNAGKIEEAIEAAVQLGRPYGYLGYSQGCANALMAETTLLAGTPKQQMLLNSGSSSLVCRQLLFSATNGSFHGLAMEKKIQRLIVLCEEFFKYQQGYVSRALSSTVLEVLNNILDSAHFHKLMGGAQSFLPEGCRFFWREGQHLGHVPTCTLRGVMEDHTTPECLEMISHLLTKQSGSPLHDSQVHVFDAVGHPVYHHNRNGRILKAVDVGAGAIQRTHHWSPLSDEVEFVRTAKDVEMASFDCAKDRHVFPWVDVNVRFGFIRYASEDNDEAEGTSTRNDDPMFPSTPKSRHHTPRKEGWHPLKLVDSASKLR